MPKTVVLATRNPDKAKELRDLLDGADIEIKDLSEFPDAPEVVEDADTLEGNALKKAKEIAAPTKLPAVADDSGLEVYYLLGAPGVISARYAGEDVTYEDNNRKLLRELTQVPARKRRARFRCVIAFVDGKTEKTFEGKVEGTILFTPRGDRGFGYDPLFQPLGSTKTFAEMEPEAKNSISHRGLALKEFASHMKNGQA